jgi:hypothetical protein
MYKYINLNENEEIAGVRTRYDDDDVYLEYYS